ncbi:MAG: thioesterase family protein [Chloroflexi bacterium]|nr:thioesterase family protein [Chloroflexota bacterium]MDA1241140.1 thioesterase family protein [Chloroflexota bacterium]
MAREHFFDPDGPGRYLPTPHSRGPWDPKSLHGRVLAGLIAHQVEQDHGEPDFHVARLTTDMFRVAPMAPLTVTTTLARAGNRIRVVDASIRIDDGTEIARGSVVFLRRAEQPEGEVWSPPLWEVPHPEMLPAEEPRGPRGMVPVWETRRIEGEFGSTGRKQAWMRETMDLVRGVEPSPLVRMAQTSDFANPFANSGSAGLHFVNADATLYLHRYPAGEWIGVEVAAHHSADGIAIGEVTLYDLQGPVGRATVCAVANRRPPNMIEVPGTAEATQGAGSA